MTRGALQEAGLASVDAFADQIRQGVLVLFPIGGDAATICSTRRLTLSSPPNARKQ